MREFLAYAIYGFCIWETIWGSSTVTQEHLRQTKLHREREGVWPHIHNQTQYNGLTKSEFIFLICQEDSSRQSRADAAAQRCLQGIESPARRLYIYPSASWVQGGYSTLRHHTHISGRKEKERAKGMLQVNHFSFF